MTRTSKTKTALYFLAILVGTILGGLLVATDGGVYWVAAGVILFAIANRKSVV